MYAGYDPKLSAAEVARQKRVVNTVDAIMLALAGMDNDEAHTAMDVALACTIIATVPEPLWTEATEGIAKGVKRIINSPPHVAWIRSTIKLTPPTSQTAS